MYVNVHFKVLLDGFIIIIRYVFILLPLSIIITISWSSPHHSLTHSLTTCNNKKIRLFSIRNIHHYVSIMLNEEKGKSRIVEDIGGR
jgi:hypothetical protein